MVKVLIRLIDAACDATSKRIASSLRKGGALHPIFHQPVLKIAQRWRLDLADEEKAIETTVNLLVRWSTVGAMSIGVVTMLYQQKCYWDRENQRRLDQELELLKYRQLLLRKMKEAEREFEIKHGSSIYKEH